MTMTLMLSCPPAWLAASTSFHAASSAVPLVRALAIPSAGTIELRPSEQSSSRSPG